MTILKRVGYKTAILSGGFTYFGNYLRQKYGFDYVYANELEIEDGRLTGRYVGEVVDGRRKAELLRLRRPWPSVMAPTTCRCSTSRAWASPSTPNPR